MRTKTLLFALVLAVAAYLAFELMQKRNPLARVTGIFKADKADAKNAAPKPSQPAPAAALADAANTLVLSAPPRENAEEGARRFGPIADYLSTVLGRKVVYQHPGTWGGYQSDMQRGAYDLVFDGPHFVSWRIEKLHHNVLVKLPGEFLYLGFVRKDNTQIKDIQQVVGQPVCVHAPPNLGTLLLLGAFDNPSRQPTIVITEGYDNIFRGVMEGKCVAGMLPKEHLLKNDQNGEYTRVIYSHRPYPEQALTAGPRLSTDEQAGIANALTVTNAAVTLASFREAYALRGWFVRARNEEYAGLGVYLKPVQGFYP